MIDITHTSMISYAEMKSDVVLNVVNTLFISNDFFFLLYKNRESFQIDETKISE